MSNYVAPRDSPSSATANQSCHVRTSTLEECASPRFTKHNWPCSASMCSATGCGTRRSEFRDSTISLKSDDGDANMLHDFQLSSESHVQFKSSRVDGKASSFIFRHAASRSAFVLILSFGLHQRGTVVNTFFILDVAYPCAGMAIVSPSDPPLILEYLVLYEV